MKLVCLLGVLLHLQPGSGQAYMGGKYNGGYSDGEAPVYNPDHPGYNTGDTQPAGYNMYGAGGAAGYTGGAAGYTGGAAGYGAEGGAGYGAEGAAGYTGGAAGYGAEGAAGYGTGGAAGYGAEGAAGYGTGGAAGYGAGNVPGYGPQGGPRRGPPPVDPNSCAVVIPQKSKGGKKGLCIKYSIVNLYLERAIKKRDLEARLKEELYALGVGDVDPSSSYQQVSSVEYIHYLGEVLLDATEGLADRYKLDRKALNVYLPQIDTSKTVIGQFCPTCLTQYHCNNGRYRSFDGSCNNLNNPSWGQSNTPYKRYLSPDYKDLIREPRVSASGTSLDLPAPRKLSLTIHQDQKRCAMSANGLQIAFGQMLVHDIAKKQGYRTLQCCDTSEDGDAGHSMCMKMEVVSGDPTYSYADVSCMSFTRSQIAVSKGCKLGVMQQMNAATGLIDLSSVYGPNAATVMPFRKLDGTGKLKTSPNGELKPVLLGRYCDPLPAPNNECIWDAGDSRVSENWGLSVVTLLFWRLHNFICDELYSYHKDNPDWAEDQYFHECRHIAIAIFQHIAYNEWMPLAIGMKTMKQYNLLPGKGVGKYNPKVNPQIANSLASAALRTCHSNVPGFIDSADAHYQLLKRTYLSDTFFQPINDLPDNLLRGLVQQCAHTEGPSMTNQLRGYMFKANKHFGNDLAAINVQRGRDHGIPGYNKWRKWCGLKPLKTWKDLYQVTNPKSAKLMEKLYLTVDDIDLWTGGVSENNLPGAMTGETMACLIGRSFKHLKIGDRFFYDHQGRFNPEQLLQIKNVKMSTLLCELSDDIDRVQVWALAMPSKGNQPMNCDVQTKLSFSAWKMQPPTPTNPTTLY